MTTPTEDITASPYQGLMPYTEARADLFFGRDQDIVLIANNARAYPFSLLYGPSGVGKSSVLQAGVLRHIRRENERRLEQFGSIETVVAYTSDWRDDPLTLLARAIEDAFRETLGTSPEAGDRLDPEAILQFCAEHEVDLLVILDQFEECFLYHQDEVAEFADQLAGLLPPGARANVLLSIREDALAQLDQFEDAIPGVFDNTLRLEHLDEDAARSAIIEPIRYYNDLAQQDARREIEPALVDALITEVQAGRVRVDQASGHGGSSSDSEPTADGEVQVEAPFLQLVLTRLWDEETERGSSTLRASTLEKLGGAQEIVRQHLDRVVRLFGADELEVMVDAFGHLVTPSGSKIAHTASDLAELTDHDAGVMSDVLHRLCRGDQRILREVPGPMDQVDAEPRFEIFHDVLALAVLDWRRRWVAETQQTELAAAKEEAEHETREAHRRLRRARLVISGLALLVIACMVLAVVAVNARDEAARNAALDDVNQLLATDPSAALAAALKTWSPGESVEYENAFRTALDASDTEVELKLGSPVVASFFVKRPGGLVTSTEDGSIRLWKGRVVKGRYTVEEESSADVTEGDTGERVISAAAAGDQRYVVVTTDGGKAYRVDLATGRIRILATANDSMFVKAPRDGSGELIMAFEKDGTAGVYDVSTRRPIDLPGFESAVWGAAFDHRGEHLATFAADSTVRVWDLRTRRLVSSAKVRNESGEDMTDIQGEFLTADDRPRLALVTSPAMEFHRWDVSKDQRPAYIDDALAFVYDLDDNGQGELVFAADNAPQLYADPDYKFTVDSYIDLLGNQKDEVTSVRFDPQDENMVALGSNSGEVELLDITTNFASATSSFPLKIHRGHTGGITSLGFAPEGGRLITGSVDGTVRVWRAPAREIIWRPSSLVMNVRYTPDGRFLFGSDYSGEIVRFDRSGSPTKPEASPSSAFRIDPAPSGSAAVVVPFGNVDRPEIASFDDFTPPMFESADEYLTVARWNPDTANPQIAAGTRENSLVLWEGQSGAIDKTIPLGDDGYEVKDVKYSRDGSRIVTISSNGAVRIVNSSDGTIEESWTARGTLTVDISTDGRFVVTAGDDDQTVRVWDAAAPARDRLVHVLTEARGNGSLSAVTLSPDSKSRYVAVATAEGFSYVWMRSNGRLLASLQGHSDYVGAVQFDPKNIDRLVSGGDDYTISSYSCTTCRMSSDELADAARARVVQVVDVTKK
jgi:WD40 repeat protein